MEKMFSWKTIKNCDCDKIPLIHHGTPAKSKKKDKLSKRSLKKKSFDFQKISRFTTFTFTIVY